MSERFDAIVIGAGQSGPSIAERLVRAGNKVAIIERRHFGGTCVNDGCVPTKTLVASAYAAHMARRAAEYGVEISGPITVDMKRVKARKDAIVEKSRAGVTRWMEGLATVIRGHARFVGERRLAVDGRILEAPRIVINTGGRASVPPIPGLQSVPYLTNSSMMDVDYLPPHLLILGGSYIGLEFAQVFRRFGSRVTVIEAADRLILREDDDVSAAVEEMLSAEGIEFRLGTECRAVEPAAEGVRLLLSHGGQNQSVTGSHLLVAVGRRPNSDDLGLDKAGIATDERGYIRIDERCRTNVDGVWAIGDVNGRGGFTHTSYNDFEIVANDLFGDGARRVSDRITCYALFTDPPLAWIGLSEREVRNRGIAALHAKLAMSRVGRARERGETTGFMKVVVDAANSRILGAAILGIGGDEVIHALLDIMAADAPYSTIQRTMHIHPTVAEYLPTLLEDLKPMDSGQ